jgi:DNA helicase HerA-like ATPase
VFWDVFGQAGHPIRATVADMGPLLLARMLELNDVQEGVLNIAFRVASDEKLPLIDLADLRAIVNYVASKSKELTTKYGNVATTSVGAIQRRLLVLDEQGATHFFGKPALDIWDFIRTDPTAAASSTS